MSSERSRRLMQDRRRLDHLGHEGRLSARQVILRADTSEDAIDEPDPRSRRRHPDPIWASRTISAVCRSQVLLPPMFGPVTIDLPRAIAAEPAVVRHERLASQMGLDDRVTTGDDLQRVALVDLGAVQLVAGGHLGQRQQRVELRQRSRRRQEPRRTRRDQRRESGQRRSLAERRSPRRRPGCALRPPSRAP